MKHDPKTTIARRVLTIDMYRAVTTETPSSVPGRVNTSTNYRVPNGTMSGAVELRVDVDGLLAHLGERALRQKSKRARAVGGLVEIIVDRASVKRTGKIE